MKKLLLLITVTVMLGGCVVYPGDYGYYNSEYYGFPFGYAGPNINFYYSGHYGWPGYYRGGPVHFHGGHGGWHR
ncbi:MAG: hypothetical protein PHD01_03175 [Geobacteraceae bacterium]|nr:hypothetical protein [Geobacteraceae bacterium]